MKRFKPACQIIRRGLLVVAAIGVSFNLLQAQSLPSETDKLDALMTGFHEAGLFNGAVLVAHNGSVLLKKGYGFFDVEERKQITITTRFPIYSITKSLTATVILRLAETGKLRLSDKLSRFYPEFPAGDSITIEHLLTHTSGLYAYNNDYSMPTGSEDAMIRFLSDQKLRFSAGTKWEYCNTGYYLLGFIIEKVTGDSYAASLNDFVFSRSGMLNSGVDFRSLSIANKATGYRFLFPGSSQKAILYEDSELRSSGGVWSTIEDLYRFNVAMQQQKLLSEASVARAYTAFRNGYGYGWFIDSIKGKKIVSHSGGAAGFRTFFLQIHETNTCIVLLANAENFNLEIIKDQVLKLLFKQDYIVPESIQLSEAQLSAVEGAYRFSVDRSLYITRSGGYLIAQISRQEPVLLLTNSASRFTVLGMDGSLVFGDYDGTRWNKVDLVRKGQLLTAQRVNAAWGIVGTALPTGWEGKGISLIPHEVKKDAWRIDSLKLDSGAIKFRYNEDWTINLGLADNSSTLIMGGRDILVKAGTYTIWLDVSDPGNPTFGMKELISGKSGTE